MDCQFLPQTPPPPDVNGLIVDPVNSTPLDKLFDVLLEILKIDHREHCSDLVAAIKLRHCHAASHIDRVTPRLELSQARTR
jgi:hypothetical protein